MPAQHGPTCMHAYWPGAQERKRKAPEARGGAAKPPLAPQEAAAAAFRDLQASAGGVDHIVQVAAQTRWLVRHLEDCGVGSQEAQVGEAARGRVPSLSQLASLGSQSALAWPVPGCPAASLNPCKECIRLVPGCACLQEYQNRWVLRPATRPGCWEELGRLVPAEDWEGVQRHVRLAIGSGEDGGGSATAT